MPRILIREPGKNPQPYRFGLDAGTVRIGRAVGNDIVLACESISGRHANMVRVVGGFRLVDKGSTNGVFAGGRKVKHADLANGDELKLGDVGFEFELSEEEITALAAEVPAKDGEEKKTARRKKPEPAPLRVDRVAPAAGGLGFFPVLLLMLLALAAFWFGMATRHQNEFGIPLIEAVLRGHPAREADDSEAGKEAAPVAPQPGVDDGEPEELEGWDQREREEGEETQE